MSLDFFKDSGLIQYHKKKKKCFLLVGQFHALRNFLLKSDRLECAAPPDN
jgi:hypothetical protein